MRGISTFKAKLCICFIWLLMAPMTVTAMEITPSDNFHQAQIILREVTELRNKGNAQRPVEHVEFNDHATPTDSYQAAYELRNKLIQLATETDYTIDQDFSDYPFESGRKTPADVHQVLKDCILIVQSISPDPKSLEKPTETDYVAGKMPPDVNQLLIKATQMLDTLL